MLKEANRKSTKKNELSDGLSTIISSNLKQLIREKNIKQKDLAELLGVSPASMTDYCKGDHIPGVDFFVALKNLYNISIDDFLTKSIYPTSLGQTPQWEVMDQGLLVTYRKYCGIYFVYYFDTSEYKGRNSQEPEDSLVYGILYIYENPSSLNIPEFSCAAVLGFHDRKGVRAYKDTLEALSSPMERIDHMAKSHEDIAYFGDFELSPEHAFFSMSHNRTDKVLYILHRVDNNKQNYTGGIGTVNSVSKGRERSPVLQFMAISRYPLALSKEEIHHSLLLNYPTFKAGEETQEMVRLFKLLYVESEKNQSFGFNEKQKALVVSSTLERFIKKNLERNMFRYGKISERDDDEWYHTLKESSLKGNAQGKEKNTKDSSQEGEKPQE